MKRPFCSLMSMAVMLVCLANCSTPLQPSKQAKPKGTWAEVKPVLERQCIVCHRGDHPVVMPDFTSKPVLMQFVEPGQAGSSRLLHVLELSRRDFMAMPPTKHRIPKLERETIRAWIDAGAPWPEGEEGQLSVPEGSAERVSS